MPRQGHVVEKREQQQHQRRLLSEELSEGGDEDDEMQRARLSRVLAHCQQIVAAIPPRHDDEQKNKNARTIATKSCGCSSQSRIQNLKEIQGYLKKFSDEFLVTKFFCDSLVISRSLFTCMDCNADSESGSFTKLIYNKLKILNLISENLTQLLNNNLKIVSGKSYNFERISALIKLQENVINNTSCLGLFSRIFSQSHQLIVDFANSRKDDTYDDNEQNKQSLDNFLNYCLFKESLTLLERILNFHQVTADCFSKLFRVLIESNFDLLLTFFSNKCTPELCKICMKILFGITKNFDPSVLINNAGQYQQSTRQLSDASNHAKIRKNLHRHQSLSLRHRNFNGTYLVQNSIDDKGSLRDVALRGRKGIISQKPINDINHLEILKKNTRQKINRPKANMMKILSPSLLDQSNDMDKYDSSTVDSLIQFMRSFILNTSFNQVSHKFIEAIDDLYATNNEEIWKFFYVCSFVNRFSLYDQLDIDLFGTSFNSRVIETIEKSLERLLGEEGNQHIAQDSEYVVTDNVMREISAIILLLKSKLEVINDSFLPTSHFYGSSTLLSEYFEKIMFQHYTRNSLHLLLSQMKPRQNSKSKNANFDHSLVHLLTSTTFLILQIFNKLTILMSTTRDSSIFGDSFPNISRPYELEVRTISYKAIPRSKGAKKMQKDLKNQRIVWQKMVQEQANDIFEIIRADLRKLPLLGDEFGYLNCSSTTNFLFEALTNLDIKGIWYYFRLSCQLWSPRIKLKKSDNNSTFEIESLQNFSEQEILEAIDEFIESKFVEKMNEIDDLEMSGNQELVDSDNYNPYLMHRDRKANSNRNQKDLDLFAEDELDENSVDCDTNQKQIRSRMKVIKNDFLTGEIYARYSGNFRVFQLIAYVLEDHRMISINQLIDFVKFLDSLAFGYDYFPLIFQPKFILLLAQISQCEHMKIIDCNIPNNQRKSQYFQKCMDLKLALEVLFSRILDKFDSIVNECPFFMIYAIFNQSQHSCVEAVKYVELKPSDNPQILDVICDDNN